MKMKALYFAQHNNFENYNMVINEFNPGELSLVIYAGYNTESLENIFGKISFGIIDDEISSSKIMPN